MAGITTNPSLLAREDGEPLEILAALVEAFPGALFYQPGASEARLAKEEALRANALAPDRVTVKLPARTDLLALAADLTRREVPCAITAIYSPAQALVAQAAGCRWLIPYVDRAGGGLAATENVVAALRSALRPESPTRILAASIKSPDQAVRAFNDGADAVTAPLTVVRELGEHELSREAIEEFDRAAAERTAGLPGG